MKTKAQKDTYSCVYCGSNKDVNNCTCFLALRAKKYSKYGNKGNKNKKKGD